MKSVNVILVTVRRRPAGKQLGAGNHAIRKVKQHKQRMHHF